MSDSEFELSGDSSGTYAFEEYSREKQSYGRMLLQQHGGGIQGRGDAKAAGGGGPVAEPGRGDAKAAHGGGRQEAQAEAGRGDVKAAHGGREEAQGGSDSKVEFIDDVTSYVLRITLRGFQKEDFSLNVDGGGKLSVHSKLPAAAGPGFGKEFRLPSDSDTNPDGIGANFNNIEGVLTVTVPKGVWIENATNYILRINLEGFRKDDMTVQMDDADNKISVLAQGPMDGGPRFFKEYPLPSKAILNDIHANFEAGVLAVTAPKRPAAPTQTTIEEETRKAAKAKKHGESTHDPFDSDEEGKWIENATNYVLRIKLQGISKEDVRVQGNIKGGITVRGHFPDGGPCLFNESFLLPSTASLACMSASFGANILTVTVPKRTLPTLSPTAVEIRRPMAKPQTKGLPVDCTKQLPSKDDAE
ncbi:uncharacterized protein LOC112271634 [Brachypodium distachyon]|uniref:uncharacterized protein LOC112271634 n=1 Tax=Brachypodium distachyon TaxID=15368 RepID=UPI000D0DDE48|nr:uncharacterized protein LOC112271634 [Brachypodium distachyon]|eukprot:XP_024317125.1 uncharacterized protein LOC112271634 [Brachypodium distachyon]